MRKGYVFLILCLLKWISFAYKTQGMDRTKYFFDSEPLTFVEAEKACLSRYGTKFVSIYDKLENILIANKHNFEIDNITDFWIGGRRNGTNNAEWTWQYDRRMSYTSWDNNEPKNNGNCIASTITHGKWSAQNCKEKKPFVCKYVDPYLSGKLFQCPWAWLFFEPTSSCIGLTYTYQNEMIVRNWYDAEAHCNKFGGHLPSIHSMQESEIIQTFLIFAQTPIWLGLKLGNGWEWSDGSVVDYLPWYKQEGYPVQTDEAKCGRLTFITNEDCNSQAAVICKKKALYT